MPALRWTHVELMLIVVFFLMLILLLNGFHFIFFSLLVIKLGMEPGRFDLIQFLGVGYLLPYL